MARFAPMKRYLILLIIPFVLFACDDPRQKVIELQEEVMEIHDSSMVKMDAIYTQISQLRKLHEQVAGDSLNPNPDLSERILDAITDLKKADDGMMDWMAKYRAPAEDADIEESMQYLEVEKKNIVEVDLRIDESLENGQTLLDKESSK